MPKGLIVPQIRYTISNSVRRDALPRLLRLNRERWEGEQKQSSLEGEKVSEESGQ